MRSAAIAIVCLAVAVCAVAGDVAKTDAVAPSLWSQPQTQSAQAHPVAFSSNTTSPQFYNWALDLYNSQSQCDTVNHGWTGDFGICTWV